MTRGPSVSSGFNPTLVRLRPLRVAAGPSAPGPRFNPTLVRLRQSRPCFGPIRGGLFQSHAGSIEARMDGHQRRLLRMHVSIPRWFD